MSKRNISLRIRKVHRLLAVPMTMLVVANISTRKLEINQIIENLTAVSMLLMTLTGFSLFLLTMKRTNG